MKTKASITVNKGRHVELSLTYGCEIWTMNVCERRRVKSFKIIAWEGSME